MKSAVDSLDDAQEIVNNSFYFEDNKSVIELEQFTRYWEKFINKDSMPEIDAVVWKDTTENTYKVKLVSNNSKAFNIPSNSLKQDSSMEFVHSCGFFAVAKDKTTMKTYLQKQLKNRF